jgi:2-keto-4-pentenoate hydratase/2-oxohepta-3-ene-1,7-dioic acid hydratase in catechol pathway
MMSFNSQFANFAKMVPQLIAAVGLLGIFPNAQGQDLNVGYNSSGDQTNFTSGTNSFNSAVIGAFLPKKEFNSMENINFELVNNGKVVQQSNTSHMLWKIDELISHISQYFTLKIGDIIFTGTPEGVAAVKPNDVLEGYIENKKSFRILVK